jgi:hypothetical protein
MWPTGAIARISAPWLVAERARAMVTVPIPPLAYPQVFVCPITSAQLMYRKVKTVPGA